MCLGAPLFIQHADVNSSTSTAHQLKASDGLFALVIPPSSNIKDFDILLTLFNHLFYLKNFRIIIYFIYDLLYYPKYFKYNFHIFIFV